MMAFLAANFNLPTIIVASIVFGGTGWLMYHEHKTGGLGCCDARFFIIPPASWGNRAECIGRPPGGRCPARRPAHRRADPPPGGDTARPVG